MADTHNEFTESPADEARRNRYARLIELVDEWTAYSLMDDGDGWEEWAQLKALIEDHELDHRR